MRSARNKIKAGRVSYRKAHRGPTWLVVWGDAQAVRVIVDEGLGGVGERLGREREIRTAG